MNANLSLADLAAARRIMVVSLQAHGVRLFSSQELPKMTAIVPTMLKQVDRSLARAGFGSIDYSVEAGTNLTLPVEQPSPRNKRSKLSREQQYEVFVAAEAKRQRKQHARIIAAGGTVEGEL